jgi:hypothetical protein
MWSVPVLNLYNEIVPQSESVSSGLLYKFNTLDEINSSRQMSSSCTDELPHFRRVLCSGLGLAIGDRALPLKNGRLTPGERAFVGVYAQTNDATYAATKAGMKHPSATGSQILARPGIRESVMVEVRKGLAGLTEPALKVLGNLLEQAGKGELSARDARETAKAVLELTRKYHEGDVGAAKDLHEMTADELAAEHRKAELQLAALEQLRADQAKPVSGVVLPSDEDNSQATPNAFA